jgi:two-component system, OmpR family, osmolarity sensor histidine kinase EnvZ
MKLRPVDSLFGRLALLLVCVLLVAHFAWYALVRFERTLTQTRYATEEIVFLIDAIEQRQALTPNQPLPTHVRLERVDSPLVPPASSLDAKPMLQRFRNDLRGRLPPGTDIRISEEANKLPPRLWVLRPGSGYWIVLPIRQLPSARSADQMVIWLVLIFISAVISALLAAWQLQRPLQTLVSAVARLGRGETVPPVAERGPYELRQLTRGFNQMVSDISQTDSNRQIMLAGVAHDLKTPLARLRLRAEMVDDLKLRDGVVRDVDSLSHIVEQFLVFAHDRGDQSMPVAVDERCEWLSRSYRHEHGGLDQIQIVLDLRAGPEFTLPTATLDRLLFNLLDNAAAYGAPPVTIATAKIGGARQDKRWQLSVSDHGPGISPDDLRNASRPFVRLDPARGGNGHSGLGLAIVDRLARRVGGDCTIENHPEGGLRVVMLFAA